MLAWRPPRGQTACWRGWVSRRWRVMVATCKHSRALQHTCRQLPQCLQVCCCQECFQSSKLRVHVQETGAESARAAACWVYLQECTALSVALIQPSGSQDHVEGVSRHVMAVSGPAPLRLASALLLVLLLAQALGLEARHDGKHVGSIAFPAGRKPRPGSVAGTAEGHDYGGAACAALCSN